MSDSTGTNGVECGEHPRSTSDTCSRQQGWGLSGDSGPCKDHVDTDSHTDQQESPDGGSMTRGERQFKQDGVKAACETLAEAFDTSDYADAADLDKSPEGVVATALIRKLSVGADGYTTAFGECAVSSCERGCNGFSADTCDQHTSDDVGGSESQDGGGGNALADMSPEQLEALPDDVIREKLE